MLEDLRMEIKELYKTYDEVVDRIEVLVEVIRDPNTTIGRARSARQELENLIPRRKKLSERIDRYEKTLAEYA